MKKENEVTLTKCTEGFQEEEINSQFYFRKYFMNINMSKLNIVLYPLNMKPNTHLSACYPWKNRKGLTILCRNRIN